MVNKIQRITIEQKGTGPLVMNVISHTEDDWYQIKDGVDYGYIKTVKHDGTMVYHELNHQTILE
ncbi:MAG: hypothetical protein H6766_06515 [Candidatus Peribacteria bacterium]|nr:MAG: hypothetical protein H6766_06515 [Candidatus Peribacteria bacterium]